MRDLAQRTRHLVQSDIRAVTALVKEVNAINLGQGICDMPVPDRIREHTHAAIDEKPPIYTHFAGIEPLRRAVLEKVRSYNGLPASTSEDVMVSAGSTGAFVTALFALLDPGDEVILFEPFYGYHRHLILLAGGTPVFVSTSGEGWQVDFDALERRVTDRTKAIVLCTPSNPTGKVWTRPELERLLDVLERHDLYAITDEIYEYMVYDGRMHVSLGSLKGAYDRTITISGFSKTFNMTGWRLGYAVGPEPLIAAMGLLGDLLYICAAAPLQYGLAGALPMDPSYYERMQSDYDDKRTLMCETLDRCGFRVERPQGAYYVMADFSPIAGVRPGFENDVAASESLIRESGVAAVPGRSFFGRPESGATYLRFCYAKEMDELQEACRRLVSAFTR